jgi:nucleotide-binding universal stress UspA family protein
MITQILVCLDTSPSTEAAVGVALQIARDLRARVVALPIADEGAVGVRVGFESRCHVAGVNTETLEVGDRPVARILKEMAARDLVVMGRDATKSTRHAVLRRANRPVLIVPEAATDRPASAIAVVAYDGSGAATRALTSFAESGLAQRMDVRVVTAGDDGAAAYEVADRGVQALAKLGVAATPHSIVSVLPRFEALLRFAETCNARMMVMGAFGRPPLAAFATFWKGSATRHIIKRTKIPVYLRHS